MKLKVTFADPSRKRGPKPAVLIIDNPNEDPSVVTQGEMTVVQTSSYPLTEYCSPSELAEYAADHYQNLAEQFEQGSEPWFRLMSLQRDLDERRGIRRELEIV
jgi:hypothetical protein